MANKSHEEASFSKLHHIRLYPSGTALQIGVIASRPASPQGIGDFYFATDTGILYSTNAAGNAWAAATSPVLVGDSGAGGTAGLAPAPAAGDAAAGKYLDADGTWTVPPTGGSGLTLVGSKVRNAGGGTTLTAAGGQINILFTVEDWDTDALHDTGSNQERITIPSSTEAGYWEAAANIILTLKGDETECHMRLFWYDDSLSTATLLAAVTLANWSGSDRTFYCSLTGHAAMAASDYVYVTGEVVQSGDASTVLQNSTLEAHRVGT